MTDLDIAAAILYKADAPAPYSKGSALAMVEVGARIGRQEARREVLAEIRAWVNSFIQDDFVYITLINERLDELEKRA